MLAVDRVSDGERKAARQAVEAALAHGRIVQADHDRRVDQVEHAQTPAELAMVVHDLQHRDPAPTWTTYVPPETAGSPPTGPTPLETMQPVAGPVAPPSPSSRAGSAVAVAIFLVVTLMVGGVVVTLAVEGAQDAGLGETFDEFGDDLGDGFPGPPPGPDARLLTPGGFERLLGSLDARLGSTEVFEAVLYPDYGVVTTPAEPSGPRSISYYYDGESLTESTRSTSTERRYDLADVDPAVVARLTRRARALVDEPTTFYAIVRRPQDGGTAWITAYASNEFSETAFLSATLDGTVVDRYVS